MPDKWEQAEKHAAATRELVRAAYESGVYERSLAVPFMAFLLLGMPLGVEESARKKFSLYADAELPELKNRYVSVPTGTDVMSQLVAMRARPPDGRAG